MRKLLGGLAALLMVGGLAPAAAASESADTTVVIPIPGTGCEYVIETSVDARDPLATDADAWLRCEG